MTTDDDRVTQRKAILIATAALAIVAALTVLIPALLHNNTYEVTFTPGVNATDTDQLFANVPHRRLGDVVWLELEPGDSLVIQNTDTMLHELAGMTVRSGETLLHTFHERGTFSGDCSVIDLTVFIEVERR